MNFSVVGFVLFLGATAPEVVSQVKRLEKEKKKSEEEKKEEEENVKKKEYLSTALVYAVDFSRFSPMPLEFLGPEFHCKQQRTFQHH